MVGSYSFPLSNYLAVGTWPCAGHVTYLGYLAFVPELGKQAANPIRFFWLWHNRMNRVAIEKHHTTHSIEHCRYVLLNPVALDGG